jgi:hypothetical protein
MLEEETQTERNEISGSSHTLSVTQLYTHTHTDKTPGGTIFGSNDTTEE